MFTVNKRQSEILRLLKTYKHLKTQEIADMVGVSDRTIRHDLLFLRKEFYQIIIRKGKYNGGVHWEE